jgi:hypothetical protein
LVPPQWKACSPEHRHIFHAGDSSSTDRQNINYKLRRATARACSETRCATHRENCARISVGSLSFFLWGGRAANGKGVSSAPPLDDLLGDIRGGGRDAMLNASKQVATPPRWPLAFGAPASSPLPQPPEGQPLGTNKN